jgi:MFS family permease
VIIVGLANGVVILGFAFAKESVPPQFAGTASGIYNMGSILGAMILQPAIGWLLDRNWQGNIAGGVRIYDLAAYRLGFTHTSYLVDPRSALASETTAAGGRPGAGTRRTIECNC